MARTAVGPFALNTKEKLDARIVAHFESVRSRGKSDEFRSIMKVFFDGVDSTVVVATGIDEASIARRVVESLSACGFVVAKAGDDQDFDSQAATITDDEIAEVEGMLDRLQS